MQFANRTDNPGHAKTQCISTTLPSLPLVAPAVHLAATTDNPRLGPGTTTVGTDDDPVVATEKEEAAFPAGSEAILEETSLVEPGYTSCTDWPWID